MKKSTMATAVAALLLSSQAFAQSLHLDGLSLSSGSGDVQGGSAATGGMGDELKAKDLYSLYFEPGYLVANSALTYAQLSYQGRKGATQWTTGQTVHDAHENFTGMAYGTGIRTLLGTNLYLQAEFEQVAYGEKGEKNFPGLMSKPTATVGAVGQGYRF